VTALPQGFRVRLEPGVRVRDGARVIAGGSPGRMLRLSREGVGALDRLAAGSACSEAERALGRRLVDAGLARPFPPAGAPPGLSVAVAIPVRDDACRLERCLATLEGLRVLVVDDGSTEPDAVADVCRSHGAEVLRRARSGGPAAARNDAARALDTDLVAFLDSDCIAPRDWLELLLPHFSDPLVAAVAPRVRPLVQGSGAWARYARARSPLDLGPRGCEVRPAGLVPYVPTAALAVRRSLARFDEELRYGEDVDLVWRLCDAGHRVRYVPEVEVRHEEPNRAGRLLARRYRYGTSAAPLARRHPGRLASTVVAPAPVAALALALAGRRASAATVLGASGLLRARRLRRGGVPAGEVPRLVATSVVASGLGLARAAAVHAAPAVVAATPPGRRWRAAAVLAAPLVVDWVRRRPPLDPLRWTVLGLVDDAAYGAGVWRGCLTERTAAPLQPLSRRRR